MTIDPHVIFAAAIYGAWALLTLLHATDRFRSRIRGHDAFNLVPEWRFLGTNPGRADYHLLYRDRLTPNNELTEWIEIPLIMPRPWHAFAFSPLRRQAKAIMDVVVSLNNDAQTHGDRIVGSMPYLAALLHVSAQPSTELSVRRQFLLLYTSRDTDNDDPELIFCSEEHELDAPVQL